MLTIALITSHAPSLCSFRAPLIRAMCDRGVRVLALAPNFDAHSRATVAALGAVPVDYTLSRTGMNPLRDAWNTWRLSRLLRYLRPDITLAYFIKPVIYGSLAARWAGIPRRFAMVEGLGFVFTGGAHGFSLGRHLLKGLVMCLYKVGMACADRVIFLNPDDQAELVNAGLLPAGKSFLLGGIGVDLSKWQRMPPVLSPVTFLLVARLLREKGIEQYAQAARMVKQHHPEVRFILLGGVDQNPGSITRAEVQLWVDQGLLEWHGHTSVHPWLMRTSVFVLPSSYREGVPVSTQEAMAAGRPVITTDVPGCRETVIDGVNGFLVPVHNPDALAGKMRAFIEQPELIASMGEASRRIAEERFDAHRVSQRLLDLIFERPAEIPSCGR